jgi:hypothetical protein
LTAFIQPTPLSAQPGMCTATAALNAAGVTPAIIVLSPGWVGTFGKTIDVVPFQPGILVSLSAGASLTYSVEVTGDDVAVPGYNAATGNWSTFTGMGGLSVSAVGTLGAAVAAIRAHITSYSSGTLTLQVAQVAQ